MGLRRARHAHAPDGPAWSLKPGAFATAIQQGLCVLVIGGFSPYGMLSVKSRHVACEAGSRCPCLRVCPLRVFARFAGWGDMQRLDSAS